MKQDIKSNLIFKSLLALPWLAVGAIQTYQTGDWNYMLQFGALSVVVSGFLGMVRSAERSL